MIVLKNLLRLHEAQNRLYFAHIDTRQFGKYCEIKNVELHSYIITMGREHGQLKPISFSVMTQK